MLGYTTQCVNTLVWRFLTLLICAIILLGILSISTANAQSQILVLTQCLRAECGDHCSDKELIAILHVLEKRRLQYTIITKNERTIEKQALLYCAVFKVNKTTAIAIKRSTPTNPYNGSSEWWIRTIALVDSFLAGNTIDPYPRAMHWGGPMDHNRAVKSGMKKIVKMYNTFYTNARNKCTLKRSEALQQS